jgi:Family of unknown function (DUF6263)
MKKIFLATLISATLLTACSKETGPPFELALELEPGTSRLLRVTKDVKSTRGPEGTTEAQQSTQEFTYEVEKVDPDGAAAVKVSTDLSMLGTLMGKGGPGGNPLADLGMVTFAVRLAPDGAVSGVTGLDAMRKRAVDSYKKVVQVEMEEVAKGLPPGVNVPFSPTEVADKAAAGLTRILGDGLMSRVQSLTGFYPSHPVRVGGSWTRESILWIPFPTNVTTTYTVSARNETTTDLTFKSSLTSAPGGGLDYGVATITADISGKETGTLQVDNATGWVVLRSARVRIDRRMTIGTETFSLNDEGTSHVQSY